MNHPECFLVGNCLFSKTRRSVVGRLKGYDAFSFKLKDINNPVRRFSREVIKCINSKGITILDNSIFVYLGGTELNEVPEHVDPVDQCEVNGRITHSAVWFADSVCFIHDDVEYITQPGDVYVFNHTLAHSVHALNKKPWVFLTQQVAFNNQGVIQ